MKCPVCHQGELSRDNKPTVYTYKGKSIEIEQPGMWCDTCEEGILTGEDIKSTEQTFEAFKNAIAI